MRKGAIIKWSAIAAVLAFGLHCGGRSLGSMTGDSGIFGTGDTTPPTIQSLAPTNNETDVYLNPTLTVIFSEAMSPASLSVNTTDSDCSGTIQISRVSDNFASNTCVPFAGTATVSGATVSVTSTNLIASTAYYMRVTTAARDAAGNPIQAASTTTFTTGTLNNVAGVCDTLEDIRAIGSALDLNDANAKTTIGSGTGTTCTMPQHTVTMVNRDGSNMGFYVQRTKSSPAIFVFTGSVDPTATLGLSAGDTVTINAGVWANLCVTHFRRGLQIAKYTSNACTTSATFGAGDFTEGTANSAYLTDLATDISAARAMTTNDESRLYSFSLAVNITSADAFDYAGTYGATATPFKIRKTNLASGQLGIGAAVTIGRMIANRNNDDWEFNVFGSGAGGTLNYDGITPGGGENGFGFKNVTYTTAPVITAFMPGNGNLLNIGSTQISVTFDQQMNAATVTSTSMKVVQGSDCTAASLGVVGNPVASNNNRTFTLTLTGGQLTNTTQYTTCITTSVANISGVTLATAGAVLWTATNQALLSDLIISEYLEGNANNKFIEIYNGTGLTINLDNYRLGQYNNGSATLSGSTVSFPAGTTLNHGQTWVVCNSAIDASLTSLCSQTSGNVVNMNGDDAIVLQKNTGSFTDLDILGEHTGTDPGAGWNIPAGTACASCTGGASTVDTILKRANSVTGPTANPATSFSQWNPYAATNLASIEVYHGMGSWDSTPPTRAFNVVSAAGSAGTSLAVTFNFEPSNATGPVAGNYSIKTGTDCGAGTSLAVTAAVQSAKVITLTTAAQTNGAQYIVCVTGVLRYPDNAALSTTNSALFTGTADTTAPTIPSSNPAGGATGTVLAGNFSVTFSEAMNVANAQAAYSVKETNCNGSTMSAGNPAASSGDTIFTFALTGLKPSTVYAHCVTTGATDVAGNALATAYAATFTTAALAEPTLPTYTAGNAQVTLGWTNSANADSGVKIVRADGTATAPADCTGAGLCTGATCNATLTAGSSGRTYVDSTVVNGTQYAYRICANHTGGYLSAGVTGTATPNNAFNVDSAASTANTTATVTFSAAPNTAQAQTAANYEIVLAANACGSGATIAVSAAALAGNVVTLTTAAQTAVSYKVCVSNVTRNSDSALLTTNSATFMGMAGGLTKNRNFGFDIATYDQYWTVSNGIAKAEDAAGQSGDAVLLTGTSTNNAAGLQYTDANEVNKGTCNTLVFYLNGTTTTGTGGGGMSVCIDTNTSPNCFPVTNASFGAAPINGAGATYTNQLNTSGVWVRVLLNISAQTFNNVQPIRFRIGNGTVANMKIDSIGFGHWDGSAFTAAGGAADAPTCP